MRWLCLSTLFIASLIALCGCGGRSDVAVDLGRQNPVVTSITVDPLSFSFAGGTATVSATVDSDHGVKWVTAEMTQIEPPADRKRLYVLSPTSGGVYQTTIPVPSNIDPAGRVVVHEIAVVVQDADGVASEAKTTRLEVQAAPTAPPAQP